MRTVVLISVGAIAAVLLMLGCPKQQPPAPSQNAAPQVPALTGLPISMTASQRTTSAVPGSNGAIGLTIDDITRGQVIASLAAEDGKQILAPMSLAPGKSAAFQWGESRYLLTLEKLDNELIGEDSATFAISSADASDKQSSSITPGDEQGREAELAKI